MSVCVPVHLPESRVIGRVEVLVGGWGGGDVTLAARVLE